MSEYAVSDELRRDLERRYKRIAPAGDSPERHGYVMDAVVACALVIARSCPDSRERDAAFARLEEAQFWSNAAIARHPQC